MLAISNSVSNFQLLLACGILGLLYALRPGPGRSQLRSYLLPGVLVMVAVVVAADRWWPTEGSYADARNHRLAVTAAEMADREVPGADCVVVLDGSSVFAYGVDVAQLRKELTAAGHKPSIIPLSIAGGDHFEREYMAEHTWALMRPATRKAISTLPVIWVKELHWHYDSRPGRVITANPDTARALTLYDPERAAKVASVVWQSREITPQFNDDDDDVMNTPSEQVGGLLQHGIFNLFQVGHLQRLVEGPARTLKGSMSALENEVAAASTSVLELLPASKQVYDPSEWHVPPPWFVELLHRAPSGWDHSHTSMLLVMLPALSPVENTYAAQLVHQGGFGPAYPMILGPQDQALREKLDDPDCWRDPVHLKKKGTAIATTWLAENLLTKLPPPSAAAKP